MSSTPGSNVGQAIADPSKRNGGGFEVNMLALAATKWRLLVMFLVGGLIAALLVIVFVPPRYEARVVILPRQNPSTLSLLQGITDLGLSGASTGGTMESLYGKIVESDRILESLISVRWQRPGTAESSDLYDLLHVRRGNQSLAGPREIADMKKRLRQRVLSFERDKLTGYMEVRATVPRHAWLAAAMADTVASQLDSFMKGYRAGKATEQSLFVSDRVKETEIALRAADDALAAFVSTNRSYQQSMLLSQEYRRLSREVEALTSVWIELRRQLELARIESNDRKQSLDILDTARVPVECVWPRRTLSVAAGVALGVIGWICLILGTVAINGLRSALRRAGSQ